MWHYCFPHYWILVTTWCLVYGHILLHAKFTLNNYYHYSLKYWPVGAWHFHIHCLSTGQWVLESHNGRRDDSETSPFQSCPTINPKSPQQEWNGRQRSISRVFCRSRRVQMSQISLCKVSQFLAPVSLFRARAKARISIECGPFECGSFECGSVRVRGAHSSHLNRCLPRPWSKWWAPRRAGMDGLWRERRRRLSCFAAASPPRSPLCGLITRQRWGCSALWAPLLHTHARKKGGKGHKVSVMFRLVRDQAVWAIAHCHCPPLSLDPPSTCCKEGQPYQGSHRCSNI